MMRFLVENEWSTFEVSSNDAVEDGVILHLTLKNKLYAVALELWQVEDLICQLKEHFSNLRTNYANDFLTWIDGNEFHLNSEDVIDLNNMLVAYQASFLTVGSKVV